MAAKLTILTHKIAVQQRVVPFAVLAPGGQSGNVWIHPRIWCPDPQNCLLRFCTCYTESKGWINVDDELARM